jgi:hypothetical protein
MQLHGRVWWLTWRNAAGEVQYENSGTSDAKEAQRIMAERALPRARAAVEALERIANGETYQGTQSAASGRKSRAGRATVPAHSGSRRKATGTKKKGGRS